MQSKILSDAQPDESHTADGMHPVALGNNKFMLENQAMFWCSAIPKCLLNMNAYKKQLDIHSLAYPPTQKICFEDLPGTVLDDGEK